jgi:hypothetical protein
MHNLERIRRTALKPVACHQGLTFYFTHDVAYEKDASVRINVRNGLNKFSRLGSFHTKDNGLTLKDA